MLVRRTDESATQSAPRTVKLGRKKKRKLKTRDRENTENPERASESRSYANGWKEKRIDTNFVHQWRINKKISNGFLIKSGLPSPAGSCWLTTRGTEPTLHPAWIQLLRCHFRTFSSLSRIVAPYRAKTDRWGSPNSDAIFHSTYSPEF